MAVVSSGEEWQTGLSRLYFIFGALCPSKSGLMNKHIVKHIVVGW